MPVRALVLLSASLWAAPGVVAQEPERRAELRAQVHTRLEAYADAFPELRFLVLDGAPAEQMARLGALLGEAPASLDYEHPADLRADLMVLSLARIQLMLEAEAPSASLLHTGTADERPLCVITLAPCAIARDDRTATCHLLGLSPEQGRRIDRERYLPCEDYLGFVVDHEAYHCLDAWAHGPQPMSSAEHWGEYWQFRGENGADAFAMARHVQRRGGDTAFAANFARIRDWSLLHGGADHWSGATLARLEETRAEFSGLSARATLAGVTRLRDAVVGDYADFLIYRASVAEALRRRTGHEAGDAPGPAGRHADPEPALVKELSERLTRAQRELLPE